MKAGVKTSEFWVTIVTALVGIAVTLGWVSTDIQTDIVQAAEKLVGGIIAVAGVVAYILGRSKVKAEHEANQPSM